MFCFSIQVPTFAYEKRLSRIETLRLAITYISFMDEILTSTGCNNNNGNGSSSSNNISSPFRSPSTSHLYGNMYPSTSSLHRSVCH